MSTDGSNECVCVCVQKVKVKVKVKNRKSGNQVTGLVVALSSHLHPLHRPGQLQE